jgi:hypothetical protein
LKKSFPVTKYEIPSYEYCFSIFSKPAKDSHAIFMDDRFLDVHVHNRNEHAGIHFRSSPEEKTEI